MVAAFRRFDRSVSSVNKVIMERVRKSLRRLRRSKLWRKTRTVSRAPTNLRAKQKTANPTSLKKK